MAISTRPIRLRRPLLWQRVSTLMWARRVLWLLVLVLAAVGVATDAVFVLITMSSRRCINDSKLSIQDVEKLHF